MVKKSKTKDKGTRGSEAATAEVEPEPGKAPETSEDVPKDLRVITITLESYQNIMPVFPISSVSTKCKYFGGDLGESAKVIVTDSSLLALNHEFSLTFDVNSSKDLDLLVSTPVIFTMNQMSELQEIDLISEKKADVTTMESLLSVESAITLYEALTGDVVEKVEIKQDDKVKLKGKKKGNSRKNKEKSSKQSVKSDKTKKLSEKRSKTSGKSTSSKGGAVAALSSTISNVKEYGTCTLDLLPIFFGQQNFEELLLIDLAETFCDDRMVTYRQKPGLSVKIFINKELSFECSTDVMNLTVESIHNVPSVVKPEMSIKICSLLPSVQSPKQPLLLAGGKYRTSPVQGERKVWPGVHNIVDNTTKYKLSTETSSIKNNVNIDLDATFRGEKPRIEFNCIKRNFLLNSGFLTLYDQIQKHRNIVLEIYCSTKNDEVLKVAVESDEPASVQKKSKGTKKETKSKDGKKSKGSKTDKGSISKVGTKTSGMPEEFLHLMSIVDVSAFLYPGVSKVRVASPLTTYHEQDALLYGGLEDSYFLPKPPPVESVLVKENEEKTKKGSQKSSKKDKSSGKSSKKSKSSKSSKEGKGVKSEEKKAEDLKGLLPPEPAPAVIEPSTKVYNEDGDPTFIVIEIELTKPLVEPRNVEDLHANLSQLVHVKPTVPKSVIDSVVTEKYYKNLLKQVILAVNKAYAEYVKEKSYCHCSNQADFLTFLRRTGAYQTLQYSMVNVAAMITQNKLKMLEDHEIYNRYPSFVEEVFVHLVAKTNEILHKQTISGGDFLQPKIPINSLLFYAKEATELRDHDMAERYYLERISSSESNADAWFDYAVYKIETGEVEKGFVCIQEALGRHIYHRNSLLLNGIMLANKKRKDAAETCLLTLMVQEPRWMEGWAILYLFYKSVENRPGMEFCKEMALKHWNDPRTTPDYFLQTDDLAWITSIVPNRIFFKAASLLLKLRMYEWVEDSLSLEMKHPGVAHYLLGAICYYKGNYEHALDHLQKAKFFHGSDYGVTSLVGHCHFAMGNLEAARQEYLHILESFERPDDMHLVYVNYSQIAEILGNTQEARKLILTACKHSPSPYTWHSCGVLYFKQQDLLSAEECFSESIMLNHRLPGSWAYLTLINLRLGHHSEADICYRQAVKHNLADVHLLEAIHQEFKKLQGKKK